ncbi:LAMI_0A08526g1_1 [Lachancea mirantina]|uniref:LAMI_0A08526g1_1 n=1 Tax=Lachancea mirantina TaxID=1230905 RepID=A0A1G4IRX9_9SACH|nr:LAMI_0A08526g1_1 [Lachancea mirantina]
MYQTQLFYGGAIASVIPKGFLDASLLREVPDTQEVFVNSRKETEIDEFKDGLGLDESVIVDLLQQVEETDDLKALQVHLSEISDLNGSSEWHLLKHEVKSGPNAQTAIAVEPAYKWGKKELKETLVVCIALLRLKEFETDVVITVNIPLKGEKELRKLSDATQYENASIPASIEGGYRLIQAMVREFKVLDSSLFV